LAPPVPSFWKWDDDGQVAVWNHGGTIAFRQEIEHVLRRLAPTGLPPLTLVMLVLAACRNSFRESFSKADSAGEILATFGSPRQAFPSMLRNGLERICVLPSELRRPIEAKAGLVECLLEKGCRRTSPAEAAAICDALLLDYSELPTLAAPTEAVRRQLQQDVPSLIEGLGRFDPQSFQLRQLTGLDQLLGPAEIDVDPVQRARELISNLKDDRELHGLARLARSLMAVVQLPRHLAEPEDLPMGGYSDIANRGPLDRLLVSELAHDNLTLAVRVALNEALYVRRETPRKTPPMHRRVLIDAGIRLWGVPRLFATAVALAIVATADRRAKIDAYRAKGEQVVSVDLATRSGLVKHLAALEPDAHPGRALPAFLAETAASETGVDSVVVTSADAARDVRFRSALKRWARSSVYVATVTRDGDFQMTREGGRTPKVICQAKLSLGDILFPPRRPTVRLLDGGGQQALPAIFSAHRFPLRIPQNQFRSQYTWTVPACGVFEIARDGRLLFWDQPGLGPRQLAGRVQRHATLLWSDAKCRGGQARAVVGHPTGEPFQLLRVDVEARSFDTIPLELDRGAYNIRAHGDAIFAVLDAAVRVLRAEDGRCTQVLALPDPLFDAVSYPSSCGRLLYSRNTMEWYALAFDGATAVLDKMVEKHLGKHGELVGMFERHNCEGPIGVAQPGYLHYLATGRLERVEGINTSRFVVNDVSPTGDWLHLLVGGGGDPGHLLLDVARGYATPCPPHPDLRRIDAGSWVKPMRGVVHRRFKAVAADHDMGLVLISRKDSCWRIVLEKGTARLVRADESITSRARDLARWFRSPVPLKDADCALQAATWEDGSRAYWDSRGLLHLKSADSSIPEATLVLADGEIAGWCSDNRLWGCPYFLGEDANDEAGRVWEDTLRPFIERLP
jgi:hypothetical protein